MHEIIITIAIAIYNVERFLGECIDSILCQLDNTVELLLVDDGSTDSSGIICDQYAKNNDGIIVIHQKNGGLSVARNTAIHNAHGKWLIFVDGDDRLTKNAISIMKQYVEENAQLILFDYNKFNTTKIIHCCPPHGKLIFNTPTQLANFHASTLYLQQVFRKQFTNAFFITAWGKMWNISYLRDSGIFFIPSIRRGEDNAFSFTASRNFTRVCICPECIYEYRQIETSIMHKYNPKTPEHFRILLAYIEKNMREHGEINNTLIKRGYHELCVDALGYSLRQTIAHPNCNLKRKERLSWLTALGKEEWIIHAETNPEMSRIKRVLLYLLQNRAYSIIDLCCRLIRLFCIIMK